MNFAAAFTALLAGCKAIRRSSWKDELQLSVDVKDEPGVGPELLWTERLGNQMATEPATSLAAVELMATDWEVVS